MKHLPSFVDVAASGLGFDSYPVAIAWNLGEHVEGYLIAPDPDWRESAWEAAARHLHSISRERTLSEGVPAHWLCARMNESLRERTLFSTESGWHSRWLARLFLSGGMEPSFKLLDAEAILMPPDLAAADYARAEELALRDAPVTEPPKDQVRHLLALWRHLNALTPATSAVAAGVKAMEHTLRTRKGHL